MPLEPGTIYVAPPDHHLLLTPENLELSRGPRENHARPAIDPLFRSAALEWGARAIGLVLTGHLDDGTAGLGAIKACGGQAIVQDPDDALAPSMPASALANVEVDHCVPLDEVAQLLVRLTGAPTPGIGGDPVPPATLVREQAAFLGEDSVNNINSIADASQLTCPDCGGTLSELKDGRPLRYRCHTGHAYTAMTLVSAQVEQSDHALQVSLRALKEREFLLRRLAMVAQNIGDTAQAKAGQKQAARVQEQARQLVRLMEEESGSA
jgi:two-component system chemotaxis response regulator CheB